MQINPAEEWRELAETYRAMFDGELENLARDMDDLTVTARDVLRGEMKSRGLALPGENPQPARPHVAGKSGLDARAAVRVSSRESNENGPNENGPNENGPSEDREAENGDTPLEFSWKVPLCDCEDRAEAMALSEALARAGIESSYEGPGSRSDSGVPRLVVAADQLDQALQVAAIPLNRDVVEAYREEAPPYETPRCPECGEEDPVLESAEPANAWLCEACGHQWTEAETGPRQGS